MPSSATLTIERRSDHAAIVWIDDPAGTVNTLTRELAEELSDVLEQLENDATLACIVFASRKQDSFIAGANLDMLDEVDSAEDARALSELSQAMHERIAALAVPTVAAIHGTCLGGGLEFVLATSLRLCSDHDRTRLGLPEVRLGLIPGGGGTQRLPRLIGISSALDLLLSGRQLSAQAARRLHLVDHVAAPDGLIENAVAAGLQRYAAVGRGAPAPRAPAGNPLCKTGLLHLLLGRNPLGRYVLFRQARRRLARLTGGHYPAPGRILDAVSIGLTKGFAKGLEAEAAAFGDLVVHPVAAQLMGLFFATTALKKDSGVADARVTPRDVTSLGVLGAGLMGTGVSYVSSLFAGLAVCLKDRDTAGLENGMRRISASLDERVANRRVRAGDRDAALGRIATTTDYRRMSDCEVVIEAAFEDLELKQRLLAEVEEAIGGDVIFASNTSSIPIRDIARLSRRPGNVLGMHYFWPVEKNAAPGGHRHPGDHA